MRRVVGRHAPSQLCCPVQQCGKAGLCGPDRAAVRRWLQLERGEKSPATLGTGSTLQSTDGGETGGVPRAVSYQYINAACLHGCRHYRQ